MADTKQELAMITNIQYGYVADQDETGLVFGLQLLGGKTVLFMPDSNVSDVLKEHKVSDIRSLAGRPCAVNVDENNVVSFDRLV